MSLPGGVRVLSLAGVLLIAVGTTLHTVGLVTPKWLIWNKSKASWSCGLWKYCENGACFDFPFGDSVVAIFEDCIKTSEAFAVLGEIASVLGLALAAMSVGSRVAGKALKFPFAMFSFIGCMASSLFIMIAIIVWSAKIDAEGLKEIFDYGYSFILTTVGGILLFVGGLMFRVADGSNS